MTSRQSAFRFNGSDYDHQVDAPRLANQLIRIRTLMLDGAWRTLAEITAATGAPAASVSAQLRHLRKARFGGYQVEKRPRGIRAKGLFEYRVSVNAESVPCPDCKGEGGTCCSFNGCVLVTP